MECVINYSAVLRSISIKMNLTFQLMVNGVLGKVVLTKMSCTFSLSTNSWIAKIIFLDIEKKTLDNLFEGYTFGNITSQVLDLISEDIWCE